MSGLEWQAVTPEEFIRELDDTVTQRRETKYAFQVGLRDLEFEVDKDRAKALELTLPFQTVGQAEQTLRDRVVRPTMFLENDGAQHQVIVFDPQPVGCSGFTNCVAHSLH